MADVSAPELIRRHFDKDVRGGMPCPKCSAPSRVLDSRPDAGGKIRRRRMCVTRTCLHRFTTQEVIVDRQLPLVFGDLFEAVSKRLLRAQIELTDIQDAINSAQKLAAMMKERA